MKYLECKAAAPLTVIVIYLFIAYSIATEIDRMLEGFFINLHLCIP